MKVPQPYYTVKFRDPTTGSYQVFFHPSFQSATKQRAPHPWMKFAGFQYIVDWGKESELFRLSH